MPQDTPELAGLRPPSLCVLVVTDVPNAVNVALIAVAKVFIPATAARATKATK